MFSRFLKLKTVVDCKHTSFTKRTYLRRLRKAIYQQAYISSDCCSFNLPRRKPDDEGTCDSSVAAYKTATDGRMNNYVFVNAIANKVKLELTNKQSVKHESRIIMKLAELSNRCFTVLNRIRRRIDWCVISRDPRRKQVFSFSSLHSASS